MGIIAKPLGLLLTGIYNLTGNYGVSLIILTVLVKCILYPLYVKQIKSTAGIAEIQPKMQEIQRRYADDQEKQQRALQELYKEHGYNPMGGCLPMLIQFPIIMGLFALLRNPMQYMSNDTMLIAIHESFLWIKDLAQPDSWILPVAAAVATFFSFSMNSAMNMDQMGGQGKTMQYVMKYFFPLSILVLARAYPAGLAIYWAFGQFLQIFFNIRMNKVRDKMKESQEKAKLVTRAEKELQKKRNARKARLKGNH